MSCVTCSEPRLLYYRFMVPNWLRKNAKWECTPTGDDLNLRIPQDSSDWETIFRVKLLGSDQLANDDDYTVKMKVGVILPEPQQKRDPMSYMISDGDYAIGIQLLDPNHDYATSGPYQAVEGEVGMKGLRSPTINKATTVSTRSTNNPDQFEIKIQPKEAFGTAYCAIDDGHKIVAQYQDGLRPSKGLEFHVYRYKSTEEYVINYVEVEIYKNSPAI